MNKAFPLLFLICSLFSGCSENQKLEQQTIERTDKAFRTFQKAKTVEDVGEKLRLLSQAAAQIESPDDTLLTEILDHQIYFYDAIKLYDSSLHYANLMIEKGIETGDTSTLAKAYYRRGRAQLNRENHLEVLRDMHQSQKLYLFTGDSTSAGRRLVELGIAQFRLGDFSGSQASQIQALKLLQNSEDSIFLPRIYNNLAMTYRQLGDLDEAIDEYKNALRIAKTRRDSLALLNNIANIYQEKKDYERSLNLYDSILHLATDKTTFNRIKGNLYYTQWLQNKSGVEDEVKDIMKSRQQENDLIGLMTSYNHLTRMNLKEDPEEALQYAEKYHSLSKKLKSLSDQTQALGYLIQLSPPVQNKKYSLEYMRINDSLSTARNRVKNLFAKIKYDEEQKIKEIKELETLTSNQKLELLQERNRRNLAISTAFLLLASAFFVYYLIKQGHKKKTIREIHQTEVRISKRIHDELANDVYNVITEVENPASLDREVILNKLDSIYSRTRNISRENTPVHTGPGFAEDLQYMLSHSTPAHARLFLTGFQDIAWEKLNAEAKIVIYRSLQELMVNMNKHSEASIIGINFRKNASRLQITYNDNGVGAAAEQLKKASGLQNVENRIVSIGGTFNFQSDKDKGFSANILISM
ncbi:tetratricopeptide repeat-containing sensor histidine kinase [Salinimicrobium xinjiangense]|uniref:tetratricopeptide repeat-containing sensor histidine kinase n=1 Tax=Salinimicrobium xinjiangense TaxID=438596 RepID=UPI000427CBC1|nr:tetratricopeptide repeat protein [Salinimicrobium xinjiangense]